MTICHMHPMHDNERDDNHDAVHNIELYWEIGNDDE